MTSKGRIPTMKKIYALSAAIILSLSLCACGNVTKPAANSEAVSEKAAESISESAAETEESSEEESESSAEDTQSSETITESQADSKEETSESQAENETPDSDSANNEQLGDIGIEKNDDGTVTMMFSYAFLFGDIDSAIEHYSELDGFIKSEIKGTDEDKFSKHLYLTFTAEGYQAIADEAMEAFKYSIASVPKSYETITDLKFNEEFTDFYIYTTNQTDFENSDDISITEDIEYHTTFYHVYALDDDDVTITYHFMDADGNEFLTDVLDDNERQSLKKVEGTERHYND